MRFLFCSFTTPGFLFPLVGLSLALRARGRRVAFVSGPSASPLLERYDLRRADGGGGDGPRARHSAFDVRQWGDPAATARGVERVEDAVDRFEPDVVVTHQLCQAPLIVRDRRPVRLAVLGLAAYLWPPARPATGASRELDERRRAHLHGNVKILNRARARVGLEPVRPDPRACPFLGDLFLLRTVPAFEPDLASLPARVHAVGACLWHPEEEAAEWTAVRAELDASDGPVVFVQGGRVFDAPDAWPRLLQALADLPVRVVASPGRRERAAGDPPEGIVLEARVPHDLVMPRARVAVSNASSTIVLSALTHGVPNVLLPVGGEGPALAERVVSAGCGVRLPAAADAGELGRVIGRLVTDEESRRRCRPVREAFRAVPGLEVASGLVERLARRGGPLTRPTGDPGPPPTGRGGEARSDARPAPPRGAAGASEGAGVRLSPPAERSTVRRPSDRSREDLR